MLYGHDVLQPRDPEAPFDMHRAMMSFSACLHSEYGISDPVFHVSLSPHPDDKLTDEQQIAIAQEYMHGIREPALLCIPSSGHRTRASAPRVRPGGCTR